MGKNNKKEDRQFKYPNLSSYEKKRSLIVRRFQIAKKNFLIKNILFFRTSIKKYMERVESINLNIPNINETIRSSIESLSFPKQSLKQLEESNGSGRNGRLCNLESGWSPKFDCKEYYNEGN